MTSIEHAVNVGLVINAARNLAELQERGAEPAELSEAFKALRESLAALDAMDKDAKPEEHTNLFAFPRSLALIADLERARWPAFIVDLAIPSEAPHDPVEPAKPIPRHGASVVPSMSPERVTLRQLTGVAMFCPRPACGEEAPCPVHVCPGHLWELNSALHVRVCNRCGAFEAEY